MAYKALYRTYRPSTFEEVAGQQHIVKTIKNALKTGKIAHAYLFTGPRGTGKTTMAKLLAKALNCENGLGSQCNECKNCKAIMDGTHPDVLELDAASNNGVDNIRELIDNVKYGTILGQYKVYIIDEVHMLSAGAFNALLKTLEEPPENVIFILATTEPHKVLPTILSRCQRYDFSKVSEEDIRQRIQFILNKENIEYNETAINLIIKLADGGMRDALSILDQVLAYSGDKLNEEDVLNIFALESKEEKTELLKSVFSKDVNDVLNRLNKYVSKGTDLKRLTEDLLLMLKDILIFKTSRNTDFLEVYNEQEIRKLSLEVSDDELLKMIEALMNANKDYKGVTSIAPVFEITLLKLISFKTEKVVENKPQIIEEKPIVPEPVVSKQEEEKIEEEIKPEIHENIEVIAPAQPPVFEEPKIKESGVEKETEDLNQSMLELDGARHDDHFEISQEDLLKMIVISKKDIKTSLLENWNNIRRFAAHPKLCKAASLLIDGRPLVASDKFVIIEYQIPSLASRANLIENQLGMQNIFESIFNKRLFVYAINRSESVDLQNLYRHMYQVNQLPSKDSIDFNYLGE